MRRSVNYPRNGERRLRDTIKDLKSLLNQLRKENRMLRDEIDNIMKPERPRREHVEEKSPKTMTKEEWRLEFIKNNKPAIDKRLKEFKNENAKDDEKGKG